MLPQLASNLLPVPLPRLAINVRPAVMGDLPFIDGLQKKHTQMVGWMPRAQLEEKIGRGQVIIAEAMEKDEGGRMKDEIQTPDGYSSFIPHPSSFLPVGYCIGHDQYFKRDDVGIIYQMNVLPDRQRGLIGATLLKAMFERAAYGCRLFCCWCAQDLAANYFWESMGFVPLAFRAGSRGRGRKSEDRGQSSTLRLRPEGRSEDRGQIGALRPDSGQARVHIFWQRRIRAGDTTTPYWFPSQTSSGAIREDRLVLPIPPGVHWRAAMPIVLPGGEKAQIEDQSSGLKGSDVRGQRLAKRDRGKEPRPRNLISSGGLRFAVPGESVAEVKSENRTRSKIKMRVKKNDPKLVAAARELRDRWMERVNGEQAVLACGKYDVSRSLAEPRATDPTLLINHTLIAA